MRAAYDLGSKAIVTTTEITALRIFVALKLFFQQCRFQVRGVCDKHSFGGA